MSDAALKVKRLPRRLRISISAADPEVLAELRELLEQAGHEVVLDARPGFAGVEQDGALLTPREVEVLAAIGEGLTNKQIAQRLEISLHTVKFHVESLFRKLGARTRTEALANAAERQREI